MPIYFPTEKVRSLKQRIASLSPPAPPRVPPARRGAFSLNDDNPDAAPRGAFDLTSDDSEGPSTSPFRVAEQQRYEETQNINARSPRSIDALSAAGHTAGFLGGTLGSGLLPESAPSPLKMATEEALRPSNYLGAGIRALSFAPKAGLATRAAVEGVAAIGGRFAGEAAYDLTEGAPEPLRQAASAVAGLAGNVGVGAGAARVARGAPAAARALGETAPLLAGEAAPRAEIIPGAEDAFTAATTKLRALLNREGNLRRSGTAGKEIAEGRSAQAGGIAGAIKQGGTSLEEIAQGASAGARTGALRKTFAEPLLLSPEEDTALSSHLVELARSGEIGSFEYLTAARTLDRLFKEGGQRLQPAQRKLLSKVIGEDLIDALESRPPTAAATARRETAEILKERVRLDKLSDNANKAALKAEQQASVRQVDTRIRELGGEIEGSGPIQFRAQLQGRRTEAARTIGRAEELELERLRAYNSRFEDPATPEVRSSTAIRTKREIELERSPNHEMLKSRALEAATRQATKDGVAPDVVAGEIDLWLRSNRALLDSIRPDAHQSMAAARAMLTGDVADSFVTKALVQRDILAGVLRNEGIDPEKVRSIVRPLFDRELQLHYPKGIPPQVDELVKSASSMSAETAQGGFDLFWQRMKNSMFGLDLSLFAQQLHGSLRVGGVPALAGSVNRMLTMANLPHVATELASAKLERITQYALDGVHQGVGPSIMDPSVGTLLRYGGKPGEFLDKPFTWMGDKLTDLQYRMVLGNLRNLDHEGNLVLLKLLGRDITDPVVRRTAADAANAQTYFARSALRASRRSKERTGITSPSQLRARFNQIAQAAQLFDPRGVGPLPGKGASAEKRILAATTIVSTVSTTLAMGKFLNDAIGTTEFEFDPSKPGFGTITTAGGRVIDVIPQDNVVRAFAISIRALAEGDLEEAGKAWLRFGLGVGTVLPRGIAAIGGVGYTPGQGWSYGDMPGTPMEKIGNVFNAAPTLAASAARGGQDAAGLAMETVGITNYPESSRSAVQRGRFSDLTGERQQKAIPAEAWNTVSEIDGIGEETAGYTSYGQWYEATLKEIALLVEEAGLPAPQAMAEAEKELARMPVAQAYIEIRNFLEDEWTAKNPELRQKQFEAEMRKPSYERQNLPRKNERKMLDALPR